MAIEILSRKVNITTYTELPPGFINDINLTNTRHLTVAPSWTLDWQKLTKYGLTRHFYDEIRGRQRARTNCSPFAFFARGQIVAFCLFLCLPLDEMLKSLHSRRLRTINAPFSQSSFEILATFKNLTSLTADLGDITWENFALLNLPKLQLINVTARGPLTPEMFRKISTKCKDLNSFAFPRHSSNWQTTSFLTTLRDTKIRRISPWNFRNVSFSGLISTLNRLSNLLDIELYLMNEYDLELLTQKLNSQSSLKRLAVFARSDKNYRIGWDPLSAVTVCTNERGGTGTVGTYRMRPE